MVISVECRKNFPTSCVLCAPAEGVPLELGIALGVKKKTEWWGYQPNKKFDDVCSRLDTIHQRDRRTDVGRQKRPRLRTASCGKNPTLFAGLPGIGFWCRCAKDNCKSCRRISMTSSKSTMFGKLTKLIDFELLRSGEWVKFSTHIYVRLNHLS